MPRGPGAPTPEKLARLVRSRNSCSGSSPCPSGDTGNSVSYLTDECIRPQAALELEERIDESLRFDGLGQMQIEANVAGLLAGVAVIVRRDGDEVEADAESPGSGPQDSR